MDTMRWFHIATSKREYDMNSIIYKPNILAIGGGTGLSTMLRGLKAYTDEITAVVAVADDGGGSGMLRDDLKMPPPGDIRSCILALSKTEPMMEKLLRYRFSEGRLAGQNFGNLFLAAMNGVFDGDFVTAVKNVSDVLKVTGTVLPVTSADVELVATLESGQTVVGESLIGKSVHRFDSSIKRIKLRAKNGGRVQLLEDVREKIKEADVITLGPGSLYTSVLSALGVDGFAEELKASGKPIVYINNIMTQPGETDGYTAYDHVRAILDHTSPDFLDYCIVNSKRIETPLMERYAEQYSEEVPLDEDNFEGSGIKLVKKNIVGLIDNKYIRHNPEALAEAIMDIANCECRRDGVRVSEEGVLLYTPRRKQRNCDGE